MSNFDLSSECFISNATKKNSEGNSVVAFIWDIFKSIKNLLKARSSEI